MVWLKDCVSGLVIKWQTWVCWVFAFACPVIHPFSKRLPIRTVRPLCGTHWGVRSKAIWSLRNSSFVRVRERIGDDNGETGYLLKDHQEGHLTIIWGESWKALLDSEWARGAHEHERWFRTRALGSISSTAVKWNRNLELGVPGTAAHIWGPQHLWIWGIGGSWVQGSLGCVINSRTAWSISNKIPSQKQNGIGELAHS